MKPWKRILLASAVIIGLPVVGLGIVLGLALCKAAGRADRAIERMNPPVDYKK